MSNLYKGPSKDASYQVSIHLAKRFQRRRFFLKLANQKQELPMAAMFVIGSGQNEHSLERTFHRCFLPSFTSFGWGVSEEKIKMWKVNGRQMPDAKWWQKLTLPSAKWAKNLWNFMVCIVALSFDFIGKTFNQCTEPYISHICRKPVGKNITKTKSQFSFNSKPQDNKRQKKQTTLDEKKQRKCSALFFVIIFY